MMDVIAALPQSKDFAVAVFVGSAVLSVTGLEFLRMWLRRRDRNERTPRAIAAAAATVFVAMVTLGFGDLAAHEKTFLNLSLTLFGVAGAGVLAQIMWEFYRGSEDELRKVEAHDL